MLPVKTTATRLTSGDSALARTLRRFSEARKKSRPSARVVRLGFVIDATGSRSDTWERAQAEQRRMFDATAKLGRIAVRLIHFGGTRRVDHGWFSEGVALAAAMAPVRCKSGYTQILSSLSSFIEMTPDERPSAVMLIGDCFEEDEDKVAPVAAAMKTAGIKVFAFHEGDDTLARKVFRELAAGSGGQFFRFGEDLPLGDLCEAVAVFTAGGENALKSLANNAAVPLLLGRPAEKNGRSR